MLANSLNFIGRFLSLRLFKRKFAFSLVEMMVVISLFFVMISLGLGAYFNYHSVSILNKDIYGILTMIEKTQFKALKNPQSDDYGIYIDTANQRLISFRGTYISDNEENLILDLERIDFIELNLEPVIGVSNEIIFESGTGKVENPGSFTVHDTQRQISHVFTINSQGAIE